MPLSYLTSLSPQISTIFSPAETSDYIRDHASWVSPGVHVMGALARLAKAGLPLPSGFDLSIYAHEAPSLSMVYLDGPSGGGVAATSYDRAAMHSFLEEYDDVRLAYGNQVETLFLHALLDLDLPSAVITTDVMPRLLAMDPTFRLMNLIHFMRIRGLSPADARRSEGLSSSMIVLTWPPTSQTLQPDDVPRNTTRCYPNPAISKHRRYPISALRRRSLPQPSAASAPRLFRGRSEIKLIDTAG